LITTVAGTGADLDNGDGGLAIEAGVSSPKGLAIDNEGNLYFSSSWSRLRRVIAATGVIETVARRTGNCFSGDDSPVLDAYFWGPLRFGKEGLNSWNTGPKGVRLFASRGTRSGDRDPHKTTDLSSSPSSEVLCEVHRNLSDTFRFQCSR
jgi:hypothetical protein